MSFSIIGFGAVGQVLARAFARKGIDVAVASRRQPEQLQDAAMAIGPNFKAVTLAEAVQADTVLLVMLLAEHGAVGAAAQTWVGRIVIDVTNAFGVALAQFDGLSASAHAARKYPDARFAKAFNHLPAAKLAADPAVQGGRRVIFVSTDDEHAREPANALVSALASRRSRLARSQRAVRSSPRAGTIGRRSTSRISSNSTPLKREDQQHDY